MEKTEEKKQKQTHKRAKGAPWRDVMSSAYRMGCLDVHLPKTKTKIQFTLHTTTKMNSNGITVLNLRPRTIKLPEENRGNLCDLESSKRLIRKDTKGQAINEKKKNGEIGLKMENV